MLNIKRSRKNLILTLDIMSDTDGLILEDKHYKIYLKNRRLFNFSSQYFSSVGLKDSINDSNNVKLTPEIKEAIIEIDIIYNKWKESDSDFFSKELRNCAHPRVTEYYNILAEGCSNDYIDQIKRFYTILRRKEYNSCAIDEKIVKLSFFLSDYLYFYQSIKQEIAASHPIYITIRYIYEYLTFQVIKNENKRKQEYCYHEIWRSIDYMPSFSDSRSISSDNYCECISCGKIVPCQNEFVYYENSAIEKVNIINNNTIELSLSYMMHNYDRYEKWSSEVILKLDKNTLIIKHDKGELATYISCASEFSVNNIH